jgi:hypothetical protein
MRIKALAFLMSAFLVHDLCLGQQNRLLQFTVLSKRNHTPILLTEIRVNCSDGVTVFQLPDSNGIITFDPSHIKSDSASLFIRVLTDTILATRVYKDQIHPVDIVLYVDMDAVWERHKNAIDLPKKKSKKKRRD